MQPHNQQSQQPPDKKPCDLHAAVPPSFTPSLPSSSPTRNLTSAPPTSQLHGLTTVTVDDTTNLTDSQTQHERGSSGSQAQPSPMTVWPGGRSQLQALPVPGHLRMAGDPHAGPSNLRRLQADGAAQPASGPPEAQRFEQWSAGARITELEERDGEGNERREERLPVQGPPSGDHQAGLLSQQRFRVEAAARPISSLLEGIRNEQWWAGARGMGSEGRDEDREKRGGEMLPLAGCKELEGAKIAGKEMREGDVAEWGASTSGVHLRGEEGAWEMGDAKVGPFGPQHSSREETREGFVAVWGGNAASSTADERYVEGVRLLEGMNINFLERPLNKRRDERRDGAGMGGNLDSDSAGARRVEGDGELEDSKAGLLEQLHRGYDSVGEEEQEEANLVQLDLNHTPMWEALGVASGAATMGELRRTHAVRRPPEGLHSDDEQGQEEQQMLAQRQQQPCTRSKGSGRRRRHGCRA